jgi:putative oxidoreductase
MMNSFINLGKYLFAIPFIVFGAFHFMHANDMAGMAPGGAIMVYVTGAGLVAAGISMLIGKYDKLGSVLLAVMMLLFIWPHYKNMASNPQEMVNILKNLALAGAALLYASTAKDNSVIG